MSKFRVYSPFRNNPYILDTEEAVVHLIDGVKAMREAKPVMVMGGGPHQLWIHMFDTHLKRTDETWVIKSYDENALKNIMEAL